jgi:hypothetical protein
MRQRPRWATRLAGRHWRRAPHGSGKSGHARGWETVDKTAPHVSQPGAGNARGVRPVSGPRQSVKRGRVAVPPGSTCRRQGVHCWAAQRRENGPKRRFPAQQGFILLFSFPFWISIPNLITNCKFVPNSIWFGVWISRLNAHKQKPLAWRQPLYFTYLFYLFKHIDNLYIGI